jgi:predicted Rossmann fold flavoprotein
LTQLGQDFDVIVIGAGAAGLMHAASAGKRNKRVALLDHNALPGRKILISGGGRCNFTNIHTNADCYLSANPHFAKSALAGYTPQHFLELVKHYKINWHEKTLGQLFCNESSRSILEMLLTECESGKVEMIANAHGISVNQSQQGFEVECTRGTFRSAALVIATGGLSIPKLGASSFGYDLAERLGLKVVTPRPALVPLVLAGKESNWTELAGLSTQVRVSTPASRATFEEKMLFTHRGLSGPAILQISSYWNPGKGISVDLAPGIDVFKSLKGPRRDPSTLRQALRDVFPARLAEHLISVAAPKGWTNSSIDTAESQLHDYTFHPSGTEGYFKAEVTAGGVDTSELNAKTMEVRRISGLFFIGEVVDVTGHLGGYNFQWAWASAIAAARAL